MTTKKAKAKAKATAKARARARVKAEADPPFDFALGRLFGDYNKNSNSAAWSGRGYR